MADALTHFGVGMALSAHAESPSVKATIIIASVLPDLGDLPLWRHAARTMHRLFQTRQARKKRLRHLYRRPLPSLWWRVTIFFHNLYGPFHRKRHVPAHILRLYHALHSLFVPALLVGISLLSEWRPHALAAATGLFVHQFLDYFTHEGRWAVRLLWPLKPQLQVAVPGQYNWWDGTYARYVPLGALAFSLPYALLGLYYPEYFYFLY